MGNPVESELARVGILLPPVWTHVYLSTARLLQYILDDLGIAAELIEFDGRDVPEHSIVIGWNLFREPLPEGCRYILYQLEPLCFDHWQRRKVEQRVLFERALEIWDYSQANLPYLRGLQTRCMPLGYHPRLREVMLQSSFQEFDVLFAGFVSDRRRKILEPLMSVCSVSAQPLWGNQFQWALAHSKIVLNLHQYDGPTPLEQPRIAYALNQAAFVLSERSADDPYPKVVTCSYDELIDTVQHFLRRPAERTARQHEMFDSFTQTRMRYDVHAGITCLTESSRAR